MRSYLHFSIAAVLAAPAAVLSADRLPDSFTLGKFVPAESWLYVHGVDNPERRWIDEQWGRVAQSLLDSGVTEDVANLIFPLIPPEQRAELRERFDRIVAAVKAVKWNALARYEFVFAERLSSAGVSYDYLMLTRGDAAESENNFKALGALLTEIAAFSDRLGMEKGEKHGVHIVTLGTRDADAPNKVKPVVWLFRRNDVIGLAICPLVGDHGGSLADDVIGMLGGGQKRQAIVESPRFREALSKVKPPTDAVTFFDTKRMFADLHRMFKTIKENVPEDRENGRAGVRAMARLFSATDVTDYVITTAGTKDARTMTDEYARFQTDKLNEPVARMILNRQPFTRFDRYIPRDATSFSLSAGFDLELAYDFAMDWLREDLPEGDQIAAKLNGLFGSIGFDPKRDLFSWWSGESIQIAMPAAVVTPMSGGSDWILMIRVKDAELASCRVNEAIDWANKKFQQQGQMLMVSPANCHEGEFRQVTHPMLAMIARPVIGVRENWLIVANAPETVNKCLAVAKGDAPSILKNDRFRKEGLIAEGPVRSLSFEDLSRIGEEWGGAAAAVGVMGGMIAGMMPPDTPQEARRFVQGAMGIVAKLAPVLQQINFYSSKSCRTVVEDQGAALRTHTLVTYRRPEAPTTEVRKTAAKAE